MCKNFERNFQKKYIFVSDMRTLLHFKTLIFVCSLLFASNLYAQQCIQFEHATWDFGDIAEDGGKVSHTFIYKNVGKQPVSILRVVANCGCTTPSFSRQPVAPGAKGEIEVVYDPMYRPGIFSKNVTVKTSAGEDITLVVEGKTLPRKKSIEEQYPFVIGSGVRFSSNFHAFAYVGRGESVEESVEWVNTSAKDVRIEFISLQSSGLFTIDAPSVLPAGQSGVLTMRYVIPRSSKTYGTLDDVVKVVVDGKTSHVKLSANVIAVDRYDRMEEDLTLPKLEMSKKIVKFAEVKYPLSASDDSIVLRNEGGSDLIIRAVEYPAQTLSCSLKAGDRIPAGGSLKVRFTFNSSKCDYGSYSERVRIITNDVVQPMQSLRVTAIVVSK